ncbi:hypothetical protein RchiOBHm_Chr7g0199201 [Rosa chinensis]|uniref:Uncharacterized protein n=1 Tax=Rosa chinensis TaxID=74649 RepID=A0A2P6P7C8_ROSCH|nr:hypothetical protein RchiOBHm_Chr7g0199201 [Rosa chinensis]
MGSLTHSRPKKQNKTLMGSKVTLVTIRIIGLQHNLLLNNKKCGPSPTIV